MSSRAVEVTFLLIIAAALLIGGRSLLVEVARYHGLAVLALTVLGALQLLTLRRTIRGGGPLGQVRRARDVAFLAAIVAALAFVLTPTRWSLGASIAALEFGLALEVLARLVPAPPRAR